MRDINRIPRILKKLEEVWTASPDLRLFQLLTWVVRDYRGDLFYLEDDVVEDNLNEEKIRRQV